LARIGSLIAFHQWWAIADKVKHFRDRRQQSSTTAINISNKSTIYKDTIEASETTTPARSKSCTSFHGSLSPVNVDANQQRLGRQCKS
jgi:hypothetical protein